MDKEREENKPKKKILSLISFILFGAFSSLIIAESAVPSDASGRQSFGLSSIAATIINIFSPPKQTIVANPTAINVSSSVGSAKDEEGNVHYLYDADQAVIGTTRLFSYTLSFSEEKADVYNSSVKLEAVKSPGQGSYTETLTPSTKGGVVRIIPLIEGEYLFTLTDESGHKAEIAFDAVPRLEPKCIVSNDSFALSKGETAIFPFAMDFYDLTRSDGSVDHYLGRFYDADLANFTSSDTSIFEVSKGGKLYGKAFGEADLLYNNEVISHVVVEGETQEENIARIEIESEKPSISPLDYDYIGYGSQINAKFYDAYDNELHFDKEPALTYSSSDYLVAMVRNDHLEQGEEGLVYAKGGFVSGYRNAGKATIKAALASNPMISDEIEIESFPVDPTSVTFSFSASGTALSEGSTLETGKTISITSSFEPLNCGNRNVHVDLSDPSLASVNNNDTNTPSISLLKDGKLTISVYSVSLGEASKASITITLTPRPVIDDADMTDFASFMRKAVGHFSLFLVTGIFQAIAFFSSMSSDRKELLLHGGVALLSGFVLAGISEAIQAIPSLKRGATWSDVGIDTLGYFVGVLLVFLVFFLVFSLKKKRSE